MSQRSIWTILAILQWQHCSTRGEAVFASQNYRVENLECWRGDTSDESPMTVKNHWEMQNVSSVWHCLAACQSRLDCSSTLVLPFPTDGGQKPGSGCHLYSDETSEQSDREAAFQFCISDHTEVRTHLLSISQIVIRTNNLLQIP